ncbi:MAG: tRNA guanosine(34) transglycosylase Tgt [Acidobacteria bacterium]|nr:tRNA guanosine(34) transglycosylase Tgt [Acidobacteriota bacterium]
MSARFSFEIVADDAATAARSGILHTAHGDVPTPVFMPVATAATVKALPHEWLESLDARMVLANTYHLYLRPGPETIHRCGGLHRFMAWDRALLTDSGGYQIYSHRDLRRITPEGVHFQSHLDGSSHFLTPESVIDIQHVLSSDIAMVLDDCTPYPCSFADAERSMELSVQWARRCAERWRISADGARALFGIVQGGVYPGLRTRSAEAMVELGFEGIAVGGLSVGEPKSAMFEVLELTLPLLPSCRPRYLMGVGTPRDIVRSVALGVDMFDCVLPTRNARNGCLFTSEGRILIKNACYAGDERPLDTACRCLTCRRYSRAYLRHLFMSGEHLSAILNTMHNVSFYLDMMKEIREAIASKAFGKWLECMEKWPE